MADPQYALKIWLAKKLEPHGAITAAAEATGMTKDQLGRAKETESDDPKKRRRLQPHEIENLARHFNDLPPGYEDMTGWLSGGDAAPTGKRDLQAVPIDELESEGVGFVDGKVHFKGRLPGSTPETVAAGGLGSGKLDGAVASVQTRGIATGHAVAAEWVIPPSFLRHGLGGHPDTTIIIPVVGHSMEPRLFEGDRVIVDVSQNTWVADAIYAIAFDDDNFQVKTLKIDRNAKPKVYRIISEAMPDDEDRLGEEDFRIVGRVVGRISRP